ncbi:MAG: hypothetical protein GY847_18455 [Proteobacteria bacterium]|nr:hypothetical protein [Pseudomonadota bacterium]
MTLVRGMGIVPSMLKKRLNLVKVRYHVMCVGVVFSIISVLWISPAHATGLRALGDDGKMRGPFASVDGHISILSDLADWSLLAGTFGYGIRGGYRWKSWGVFGQFEHNMWVATEQNTEVVQGAFNIGVGADFVYANGFVRTSLALGPSILAFDTVLDDAGNTGLFIDLRPVGLRWAVHEYLVLGLDPITFALVAPVLGGIPLIYVQYRTGIYLEAAF